MSARQGWALVVATGVLAVTGACTDDPSRAPSDGGSSSAPDGAGVAAQVDDAMAEVLPDLLERLDVRSTAGSRGYVDCLVGTRYTSDVQLVGTAYADDPALDREDGVATDVLAAAGFDVGEAPSGEGLTGSVEGEGLEVFLGDPPTRAAGAQAPGGIRTLSVRSACVDVPDDERDDVPSGADNADLVPPARLYAPTG